MTTTNDAMFEALSKSYPSAGQTLGDLLYAFWSEKGLQYRGALAYQFFKDAGAVGETLGDLFNSYFSITYDIVTFDYSEGGVLVGDLFVSVDRIRENALQYNQEILTEMRRVCAHGVLHLCRYGDKTPEESVVMRSKEEFYLKRYVSRET